jgi:hypothetical protein
LDGLRDDAPELVLSRKLAEYGEVTRARAANLPPRQAGNVRLAFVGLQQRLLSSIAAFAKTLEVHRKGLVRADLAGSDGAAEAFVHGGAEPEDEPIEDDGEKFIQDDEDAAAEAAGAISASVSDLSLVDEMLEIARKHAHRPDARIAWLAEWVRTNMAPGGRWNARRLVLFTEYEARLRPPIPSVQWCAVQAAPSVVVKLRLVSGRLTKRLPHIAVIQRRQAMKALLSVVVQFEGGDRR